MAAAPKPFPLDRYIERALRRIWGWSPARRAALRRAQTSPKTWRCEKCPKRGLKARERHADHIEPVVPVTGRTNWDDYIRRLEFFDASKIQILCKPCHKIKTFAENKLRRANKKEREC